MKRFKQDGHTIVLEKNIEKPVNKVLEKNDGQTNKKNDTKNDQDYGQSFKSLIKSIVHPVTRGILTSSDPVDSEKWKEFQKYKNEFLERACNDPKLDAELKSQLQRFGRDFNSGLISKEEFDRLIELNKEQAKKADAAHKAYIDSLEKAAKDANDAILKKIKDDAIEGDDLNKYRIIQLLLLCSPLLPIPIAGVIFNALQPFLSGALDIPNFLGSFFSVDGPFGDFAWLTDKIGLDDLTTMTGDLFGGPLSVVQNLVVNPITSPIMTSVGGALAGSPLTVFALVAAFEVATDYNKREIARLTKSANILPDAKKSFDAAYKKLRAPEVERLKKQAGQYSAAEIALRKNLFVAAKAAEWLQAKHKSHPQSCKTLLENLFGDKAKGLLKPDKSGLVENLIENLYKLINEAGFKSLIKLREAEDKPQNANFNKVFFADNDDEKKLAESKTQQKKDIEAATKGIDADKIIKGLEDNFYFFEADKLDIKHQYLPAQGYQLLKEELDKKLADYEKKGYHPICKDATPTQMVDRMMLLEILSETHLEFLLNASRDPNFDFDKFFQDHNIIDYDKSMLEINNNKEIRSKQLIVDKYYLDNPGENKDEFLGDVGWIKKIEAKYSDKREENLKLVSKAVDTHYQQEFNRAKHKPDTPNTPNTPDTTNTTNTPDTTNTPNTTVKNVSAQPLQEKDKNIVL